MRDLLNDLFKAEPIDPVEAARRSVRPQSRKRFYKEASIGEDLSVRLDGKPVMTPKRRPLKGPNAVIAQALVSEWNAQGDTIDPAAMPLTRLANAIIDGVADAPGPVKNEIEKYLGSDLVFYRAEGPEGLVAQQARAWDPLLDFARDELSARFVLAQGVVHVTQPRDAIAAAAKAIPMEPWLLGATAAVTTLTGSAVIALALTVGHIGTAEAWSAAHVDEDWNMAQWGQDEEALVRRAAGFGELQAAAAVLRHRDPA